MKLKEPPGQVAHWLERMAPYQFEIQCCKGEQHQNTDGLSQIALKDVNIDNKSSQKKLWKERIIFLKDFLDYKSCSVLWEIYMLT